MLINGVKNVSFDQAFCKLLFKAGHKSLAVVKEVFKSQGNIILH